MSKKLPRLSRDERVRRTVFDYTMAEVKKIGFRAVSIDAIAEATGIAKTTLYRRWPNKAAIVMDGFMDRVNVGTLFKPKATVLKTIQSQMRTMARAFRGEDGRMIRALLAEAQFDPELAEAFRERWTLPRRKMAIAVFEQAIRQRELRPDIDLEATVDLLYGPIYYRLQMGTGVLSEAYVDIVFNLAVTGLRLPH